MSISNKTRDAIKEKFGMNMKNVNDEAGDNLIDFTKDDIKLSEDLELGAITGFEEKETDQVDTNQIDTSYLYKGLNHLNSDEPSVRRGENIYICNYSITKTNLAPFLSFNLYRYDDNILDWPKITYEGGSVISLIKEKMNTVFQLWEVELEYKGYIRYKENVYVFIENNYPEDMIREIVQGKHDDRWWSSLIAEIMNEKKTLYFPISDKITRFFLENIDFCFLINSTGKFIESPKVVYYGNYYKRIAYTAVFGHDRQLPRASLGPYYYFGNYGRAMRYALWTSTSKPMQIEDKYITRNDEGLYTRGGIVRFAVFTGKHTMLLGREDDPEDILNDEQQTNMELIKKTLKFRDALGKWTEEYDSISQGVNVVDGITLQSQTVIKKFNQQFPLSYYYVNTDQDVTMETVGEAVIE